jgi:hypothetical protein
MLSVLYNVLSVPLNKVSVPKEESMKCETCGNDFKQERATAKYCSAKCRKSAFGEKKPLKDYTAQELYDGIGAYEKDKWVGSPEHLELRRRLDTLPLDKLQAEGYWVPNSNLNEVAIAKAANARA